MVPVDRGSKGMEPQSRRAILKLIATAPIAVTFALATSPLLRFLKPTTRPLNYFQPPDMPRAESMPFSVKDFPAPWTCLPFMCQLKYVEFNTEQEVTREIPAFVIRLSDTKIVAYSRICPRSGCILNFVPNPGQNCGCADATHSCCCAVDVPNPVLRCPCDWSTFDLANDARVIRGPATRAPRQLFVKRDGDAICIVGIEQGAIV